MLNCNTLTGNSAGIVGGGIAASASSSAKIINTIVWENTAPTNPQIDLISGGVTIAYCNIQGGYSGTGNINSNPRFRDPMNRDLHLMAHSPCIDAGDNNAPLLPDVDIDGQGRIFAGKRDLLYGHPAPVPTVDMGADEYWSPRVKRCP